MNGVNGVNGVNEVKEVNGVNRINGVNEFESRLRQEIVSPLRQKQMCSHFCKKSTNIREHLLNNNYKHLKSVTDPSKSALRGKEGREVAKDLKHYVVLDYCQYNGPGYRKRTRIAHSENLHWIPRPLCNPKVCAQCVDGKHIKTAAQQRQSNPKQRRAGDTSSRDTLHGLPRELTEEILRICQQHMWTLI